LDTLGLKDLHIHVVPTTDKNYGDYATNIAFQAAKKLNKSPIEAAEIISHDVQVKNSELIERIEVAKPGFINITLKNKSLLNYLSIEHKKRGIPSLEGKKIMIEFTDPNPFKEFHIGHLYSNIVGESIARMLEAGGAEVRRVCYQGDVGLHVAKAIFGMSHFLDTENITLEDIEQEPLKDRANFLGKAYAFGATKYEEDESAKEKIVSLNKMVYEKDTEIMALYKIGRKWSLEYFESIYARLGTKFVDYYFESEAGPKGVDIVKKYKDTVFEESNGAIIFPGEKYGLHTRVFINSLGLPTYEAKELGLAVTKYNDYSFDTSIMITGNEIDEYFKVLLKALSMIEPEIASKMKHISHGMVRLPEGKMSSRTGNIVTGEWLLDEAVRRASKKIKEAKDGEAKISEIDKADVSEMVGVGAVKWALLRSGIGKDVEFSFEESVSFEGNSGPYLQYTYVRTRSVLAKAGELSSFSGSEITLSAEERSLLVMLSQYSDIVSDAAEKYSPSTISTYLFQLAQEYNLFYQKHPILKEEGNVRIFRLTLTQEVGETIKDGLSLLGIKIPEKM
jgi:arginyl-tRNA synthetase